MKSGYVWMCLFFSIGLFSCSYKHKPILLKTAEKISTQGKPIVYYNKNVADTVPFVQRIKPLDRVSIRQINSGIVGGVFDNFSQAGMVVDPTGNIRLPMLGDVYLQGLTVKEASKLLEKAYSAYYNDPIFSIEILNKFVTIFGGGASAQGSQEIPILRDNMHLIDAMAQMGGLPALGKLKEVRIIRGDYANPEIIVVDMTQIAAIKAEDLYLRSGDIIYVEPKNIKIISDAILPYVALFTVLNLGINIFLLTRTF